MSRNPRRSAVRLILAEELAKGVADLAEGRLGAQRLLHGIEQVAGPPSRLGHAAKCSVYRGLVPGRSQLPDPRFLRFDLLLVDRLDLDRVVLFAGVAVDADHHSLPRLHRLLDPERGLVDLVLDPPR